MREAKKILDKHIQNFYKKNPMARFDDIPNNVFLEAMIEYGNLVKNCSIPDVVGQSEQLFCPHCEGTDIQKNFYTDTYGCNSCGHSWAK